VTTYHSRDRILCRTGDRNASTTISSIVPVRVGESGPINSAGQRISRERAGSSLEVAAVESSLSREGSRLERCTPRKGNEDRSYGQEGEMHDCR
jgi:hypothetical protein